MKSIPFAQVKRKDRAVEDEAWIRALLHRAPTGTLATVHEGQPLINVNLFVFDEAAGAIYMHTARAGSTRTNVEREAQVCFSVSEMGRLLPADTALEMSVEYASVVVFGTAAIIADPVEATRALQLILDKYFPHLKPGKNYRPITPEELARTAAYHIQIERWSGKRKKVEESFPGAFFYGQSSGTSQSAAPNAGPGSL
jgi:nitroimidazol reductase NimA-like FMN-containing flavoprotein (pyridoxamine 5'-phosphate oxidase superfamily)